MGSLNCAKLRRNCSAPPDSFGGPELREVAQEQLFFLRVCPAAAQSLNSTNVLGGHNYPSDRGTLKIAESEKPFIFKGSAFKSQASRTSSFRKFKRHNSGFLRFQARSKTIVFFFLWDRLFEEA